MILLKNIFLQSLISSSQHCQISHNIITNYPIQQQSFQKCPPNPQKSSTSKKSCVKLTNNQNKLTQQQNPFVNRTNNQNQNSLPIKTNNQPFIAKVPHLNNKSSPNPVTITNQISTTNSNYQIKPISKYPQINQLQMQMIIFIYHSLSHCYKKISLKLFLVTILTYRDYSSQRIHQHQTLNKNHKKDQTKANQSSKMYQYPHHTSPDNQLSKSQQSILFKSANPLFQRVRNSKKIYDTFFVTGYSFDTMSPIIQYYFPSQSKHFDAILTLIYTQNSLKPLQHNSSGTKSPKLSALKSGKLQIKDKFVMLLCKSQNTQKQYLFACQIDDILQSQDKTQFQFPRLFCFITSCNFFLSYQKIIQQFIYKINNSKYQLKISSPILQQGTKEQLKILLQQHLKILQQKNVQENQYVNFGLGQQINVFIDVPPSQQSYRNLLEYRPWKILTTVIHFPNQPQHQKQKQLFGYLLIYLLTQTKIMLYSTIKSKISQAILHALQIIKPLDYVNPIIMGTLKEQHQEYFQAPMSVILGLWGEPKPRRKQKIQIFMNKKPTLLSSVLQENKLSNIDGVIFNLDTGAVFGTALDHQKNNLAQDLNYLIQSHCKSIKQQYKIFEYLLKGKSHLQNPQIKDFSQKITHAISHTQLYSVYLDKINSMIKL